MEKKRRNKLLKAAGITVLALCALAVIAGIYIRSEVREMIGGEFARITDGRYLLSVGSVKINLLRRSVTLTDLAITPADPAVVSGEDRPAIGEAHPYLFDLTVEQLLAAGIGFKNGLEIKKVRVLSPRISVRKLQAGEISLDPAKKDAPIRISIEQLIVSEGYAEFDDHDTPRNVVEGLELRTERLLVDTGDASSGSPLGENMTLTVTRIKSMNADGSIRMEVDSIAVGMAAQTLRIGSIAFIPIYSKKEFGRKSWKHKDWWQARLSGISCHGVDFRRLIADRELFIDSVRLAGGNFSSYKNRNIARDEWVKPLYHQMIQRLPVRFAVRKSVIGSFDARYEELKLGGDTPGVITFDRIGGEIAWLSNIPAPDRAYSKWNFKADLMGAAPLVAAISMPVDSLNGRFEIAAILGKMDMTLLNAMVKPLANVEIKDGNIDRLDCLIRGDAREASVDMTLLYSGLELAFLKEKNGRVKNNTLVSEIVNGFILLDSNPLHKEIRRAHRTTQRDPYRSPWNYLWRTVFGGVKETVGLGKF